MVCALWEPILFCESFRKILSCHKSFTAVSKIIKTALVCHVLGEVCHVLYRLCDERQVARMHGLWELLREVEQARREYRRAEEPQEYTGTDEVIADVTRPLGFLATLLEWREHSAQLAGKHMSDINSREETFLEDVKTALNSLVNRERGHWVCEGNFNAYIDVLMQDCPGMNFQWTCWCLDARLSWCKTV